MYVTVSLLPANKLTPFVMSRLFDLAGQWACEFRDLVEQGEAAYTVKFRRYEGVSALTEAEKEEVRASIVEICGR